MSVWKILCHSSVCVLQEIKSEKLDRVAEDVSLQDVTRSLGHIKRKQKESEDRMEARMDRMEEILDEINLRVMQLSAGSINAVQNTGYHRYPSIDHRIT